MSGIVSFVVQALSQVLAKERMEIPSTVPLFISELIKK